MIRNFIKDYSDDTSYINTSPVPFPMKCEIGLKVLATADSGWIGKRILAIFDLMTYRPNEIQVFSLPQRGDGGRELTYYDSFSIHGRQKKGVLLPIDQEWATARPYSNLVKLRPARLNNELFFYSVEFFEVHAFIPANPP